MHRVEPIYMGRKEFYTFL